MSESSANFGLQVNVSSHLAARNFSYAKQIEISNFDDKSPCKCTVRLVTADPDTVVGKPSAGGHFQVYAYTRPNIEAKRPSIEDPPICPHTLRACVCVCVCYIYPRTHCVCVCWCVCVCCIK